MSTQTSPSTSSRRRQRYGDWALVTGASDGLGREIAGMLAAEGFDLVLVARREDRLRELANDLEKRHRAQSRVIAADLSSEAGVEKVKSETADLEIGLLIAAAGFGSAGNFVDGNVNREISMLRVNCEAPLALSYHFGSRMKDRGRGGIVLIGSIVGFQGVAGQANYAATKAYIQSFGEALKLELSPHGVDVLVSAPGPINTGFGEQAGMDLSSGATPQDIARATLNKLPGAGTTIPGRQAKMIHYGTGLLPRVVRSRVISSAVAKMRSA